MRDFNRPLGLLGATALLIVACGGPAATPTPAPSAAPTPAPTAAPMVHVSLQLQWEPQAQFAGYFAAVEQGYYAAEGLDVEILRGGAEIIPQVVGSDPNGPEFTISWVPKVLEVRANGQSDLVNIAQIFQRSGTRSVSWAAGKGPGTPSDVNITSPEQFAGLNVGVWDFGNEYEVTAAGLKYDPSRTSTTPRSFSPSTWTFSSTGKSMLPRR